MSEVKVVLRLERGEYVADLKATGAEHQAFSAQVSSSSTAASTSLGAVAAQLKAVGAAAGSAAAGASALDQAAKSASQASNAVSVIPQQLQGVAAQFRTSQGAVAGFARQVDQARTSLASTATAAGATGTALLAASRQAEQLGGAVASSTSKATTAVDGLNGNLLRLGQAAAGALAVSKLSSLADGWSNLSARIGLASQGIGSAQAGLAGVTRIAADARVDLAGLAETYGVLSKAGSELGFSQARVLGVTETLSKTMTLSGASATTAAATMVQFGQGLSAGALRGDELNSVLEQAPRLAQALAEGLGKPVGALKQMAEQGQITTDAIFVALERMKGKIDSEFAELPTTIGQSLTVLNNSLMQTIGVFDQGNGVSRGFAEGILAVSRSMDAAVISAGLVAAAYVAITRSATVATAATTALNVATGALGGPIGLVVTALGIAASAWVAWKAAGTDSEKAVTAQVVESHEQIIKRIEDQIAKLRERNRLAGAPLPKAENQTALDAGNQYVQAYNRYQSIVAGEGEFAGLTPESRTALLQAAGKAMGQAFQRYTDLADAMTEDAKRKTAEAREKFMADYKGQADKMAEALKAYDAEFKGKVSDAQYKADTDAIRAKHTNKGTGTSAAKLAISAEIAELEQLQTEAAGIAARAAKQLEALHQAGLISEAQYYAQRRDLALNANTDQQAIVELELEAVESSKASAAEKAKAREKYGQELAKLTQAELTIQSDYENDVLQLESRVAAKRLEIRRQEAAGIEQWLKDEEQKQRDNLRSINDRTAGLAEEQKAVDLAAAKNISLAEAIELVTIARLEEQRNARYTEGSESWDKATQEIEARRRLAAQIGSNETRTAARRAGMEAQAELQRATEHYTQGLIDAAAQGGDSLEKYVTNLLKRRAWEIVLTPVMSGLGGVMATVMGAGSGSGGGAAGSAGGIGGLVNAGTTLYSALTNGISTSIAAGFTKFATSGIGTSLGLSTPAVAGNNLSAYVAPQMTPLGSTIGTGLGMLGSGLAGYGLSSLVSGGYSVGGGNAVNVISGIASAFLGPIAGLAGGLVNRLFGRKLKDMGIEGTLGGAAGFDGQSYQYYKGGLFRSDKTTYQDLDRDTERTIATQFKAIQGQVGAFSTVLGLNTDKIAGFTTQLKISTNGLSEQEIQEQFAEALRTGSNELAQQVLGTWTQTSEEVSRVIMQNAGRGADDISYEAVTETITKTTYAASEFAKEGEEAIDTLTRLATSFSSVNEAADALGYGYQQASLSTAAFASNVVEKFGGLEQFSQQMGQYLSNYYSDEEQRDALARRASLALRNAGLEVSADQIVEASRPQVRAFVEMVMEEFGADSTQYAAAVQQANALAGIYEPLPSVLNPAKEAAQSLSQSVDELAQKFKSALASLTSEGESLAVQLLRAKGDEPGAQALARKQYLDGMVDENGNRLDSARLQQLAVAYDLNEATRKEISNLEELKGLQEQLNTLTDTAAQALARQRDALDESNRSLWDQVQAAQTRKAIQDEMPALLDKYRTPEQRTAAQYDTISADLAAAGINVTGEQLAAGAKQGIAEFAMAISALGTTSDETRLAVMRAASSLADLKQAAVDSASAAADAALNYLGRAIEAQKEAISSAANTRIKTLQKEAEAQKQAEQAATEALSSVAQITESLTRAVRNLRGQVESTTLQDLAQARRFVQDSVAAALATGALPDAEELNQAIASVTSDNKQRYASAVDWEIAQLDQANQLAQLEQLGARQKTVAEQHLQATQDQARLLEEEITTIQEGTEKSLKALDDQLKAAQEQLELAKGMDASLKNIDAATANFAAALAALASANAANSYRPGGATTTPGGAPKPNAPRVVLDGPNGAQYDSSSGIFYAGSTGLPYQASALGAAAVDMVNAGQAKDLYDIAQANGITAAMLAEWTGSSATSINDWAKANGLPSFDVGTPYVPRDMIALIHEGEEIRPKRYNPNANPGMWTGAQAISARLQRSGERAGGEAAVSSVITTLGRSVEQLGEGIGSLKDAALQTRDAARRTRDVMEAAARGELKLSVTTS